MTINQLKLELQELIDAHGFITTFRFMEPHRSIKEEEIDYPLLCAYVNQVRLADRSTEMQIRFIVCDKVDKDWDVNLDEVISDCVQNITDVYQIMSRTQRWNKYGKITNVVDVEPFLPAEGNMDYVAGAQCLINFVTPSNYCPTDLPVTNYNLE